MVMGRLGLQEESHHQSASRWWRTRRVAWSAAKVLAKAVPAHTVPSMANTIVTTLRGTSELQLQQLLDVKRPADHPADARQMGREATPCGVCLEKRAQPFALIRLLATRAVTNVLVVPPDQCSVALHRPPADQNPVGGTKPKD